MKHSNLKQVISVFQMWKTLNPTHVVGIVSDDITYESYWVLNPIIGKDEFIDFIGEKLNTINNAVKNGDVQLSPEVIQINGIRDQYFIRLGQIVRNRADESLISVSVDENGFINKISIEPIAPNLKYSRIYTDDS